MNMWQTILNAITFGAYNPDKKFEQEVLGKATTNLEQIESLRNDVSEAVTEYEKYFPNEDNAWNPFELYDSYPDMGIDINEETKEIKTNADKNATVSNLIELEEQLQEQGKYIGMDEKTRIKAVLSEGWAALDSAELSVKYRKEGRNISKDMLEADKISNYQYYMDNGFENGNRERFSDDFELIEKKDNFAFCLNPRGPYTMLKKWYIGERQRFDLDKDWYEEEITEMYVSMILANDRVTRQNDGTYLTKTSEEWTKIDEEKEQTLRNMSYEDLEKMGGQLIRELRNRYDEFEADKSNNERE